MPAYIPEKGDFVAITFDPQSGHEQKGRRPGIVISNRLFNKATGMAIVCPITNTDRKVPFHLPIGKKSSLTGFVMVEQVKSIDFRSRKVKFIEKASSDLINDILAVVDVCIK